MNWITEELKPADYRRSEMHCMHVGPHVAGVYQVVNGGWVAFVRKRETPTSWTRYGYAGQDDPGLFQTRAEAEEWCTNKLRTLLWGQTTWL